MRCGDPIKCDTLSSLHPHGSDGSVFVCAGISVVLQLVIFASAYLRDADYTQQHIAQAINPMLSDLRVLPVELTASTASRLQTYSECSGRARDKPGDGGYKMPSNAITGCAG